MFTLFTRRRSQIDNVYRAAHLLWAVILLLNLRGSKIKNNPDVFNELSFDLVTHVLQGFIYSTSDPIIKSLAVAAHAMRLQSIYAYTSTNTSSLPRMANFADAFIHTSAIIYNCKFIFDDLYRSIDRLCRYVDDLATNMRPQETNQHQHQP